MKARLYRFRARLLLILCLCPASLPAAAGQPRRASVYEVARAASPIKVDGRIDEQAWVKTPSAGSFVRNRDGAAVPNDTEAKILYDDQFLYVSFRVADENIWSTMRRRDEHLWEEEVVEVFIQADARQPSYVELEVNPLGTMLDIYLLDIRKPLPYESWNSARLRWAVRVDGTVDGRGGDRGWACEIALPLEDVVTAPHTPPEVGDRWRLNLYRVEKLPERLGLAWSPTLQGDFHVPSMFGEMVFTGRRVP